ncbi:MAG: hypothetical protein GX856_05780 [Gammaproteobacteria bacterium]|nr:hypothetical protein [Gammaproteobacteria bacterium]
MNRYARMHTLFLAAAVAAVPAFAAAQAAGQDDAGRAVETVVQAEVDERGVVAAIDLGQRVLTLETATGTRVLPVDPRVDGFDALQVGDVVDVRYHRSILFDIQPQGSAEPGAYISERARDVGDTGRVGEQEVTVLATVVGVDGAAGTFTVQGPAGNVRTLHAESPEHREMVRKIRVGDMLRVRFREGLAVSLAPVEMH